MNNRFLGEAPSPPPPPSEVKVRTMRSDLASMAKSGGGLPQFESVKVANLSLGKKAVESAARQEGKKNGAMITLAVIAGLAVVGLLGYLTYRMFFAGGAGSPSSVPTQPAQSGTAPAGNGTQAPAAVQPTSSAPAAAQTQAQAPQPFIHVSLFKKPADQTFILTLPASGTADAASSAADLQTFNQKISALLGQANKNLSMIEVIVQTADHHGVAVGDLFTGQGATVLDPQFLAANFDPDATFFVYQDKNGFWPGYVLSLKPGENWLVLESSVAKLESSPAIPNFFLTNVGASANGFADSSVSSTAVRTLSFPQANPPATFLYGWYKTDLIISTSPNGFAAAMNRL